MQVQVGDLAVRLIEANIHSDDATVLDGKLAHNITHFARALRKAGLPVGLGPCGGDRGGRGGRLHRRGRFLLDAACLFVNRPEQRAVFAQVFRLFWRDPRYMEHMMAMMLPPSAACRRRRAAAAAAEKRAAEALLDGADRPQAPETPEDQARRDRDRRQPDRLGRGTAEDAGFRTDVHRPRRAGRPSACWRACRCRWRPS
jgi:uncharacterized protein with von Willebrand factor type A (vWA) domain